MPRAKAKRRIALQQNRSGSGIFASTAQTSNVVIESVDDLEGDLTLVYNTLQPFSSTGTGAFLRGIYTGSSRTTKWRIKKNSEEALRSHHAISTYFQPVSTVSQSNAYESCITKAIPLENSNRESQEKDDDKVDGTVAWKDRDQLLNIQDAIHEIIKGFNKPTSSASKSHVIRYLAVNYLITQMLDHGWKRGKASMEAAKFFFKKVHITESSYRSRIIREWTDDFSVNDCISPSKQGAHPKYISILSHEVVKWKCIEWLKAAKPMDRDPIMLKAYIEDEIMGMSGTISVETVRTYLSKWGFKFRKNTKGVYFDEHERADIVEYRKEWAKAHGAQASANGEIYWRRSGHCNGTRSVR